MHTKTMLFQKFSTFALALALALGLAVAGCGGAQKKDGCGKDCSKGCADCSNPNAKAGAEAGSAVKIQTAAEAGLTPPESAKCPVSGEEFKPTAETKVATYDGKTFWFCCAGCEKKFAADPAKYSAK